MVRLPWNEEQTYRFNSRPQMWPSGLTLAMTMTLNFQGQIWNWLYLCQKWSDCHEKKSEHIDWTLGLKCNHQIWPWSWPWPWFFKVKYEICYISTKSGPIATRQKANISIWTQRLPARWAWWASASLATASNVSSLVSQTFVCYMWHVICIFVFCDSWMYVAGK